LQRRIARRSICASYFRQLFREGNMATGRIRPPAPAPAKPADAAPAQAEPHPRLVRLAREVGAEIPLPPLAKPAPRPEPEPEQPLRHWKITLTR
jgi:hypothetical protein